MDPPLTPNAWLRYDLIRRHLATLEIGASFLEIGCGEGAMGARLARRFRYVGYEPDPVSFHTAKRRIGSHGTVINDFLPNDPFRLFDAVGAFEVLEHVEEDEATLRSWGRWLRPGGLIILSVPAHRKRFSHADRRVGHFRRYDRKPLENLMRRCGFQDICISVYGFPLGYVLEAARNWLARGRAVGEMAERTRASGRLHQPPGYLAPLSRLGTAPFRWLQRGFVDTHLGTGYVAVGRRVE